MSRSMRIHAGAGTPGVARSYLLAERLRKIAADMGFRVSHLLCSRTAGSDSRYLHIHDPRGRRWLIRVSNHRRPVNDGTRDDPHLDFVSFDAMSGFEDAVAWLGRVMAGAIDWYDPRPARLVRRRR